MGNKTPKLQATTTKTATPSANSAQNTAEVKTPAPAAKVEGIQFAKPKAERKKSDRAFCDHVNGKGERCQLRVLDGRDRCVNHVPAEERLTEDEAGRLLQMLADATPEQMVRIVTRSIGWYKVKQLVSGKPEGDVVLNELIG